MSDTTPTTAELRAETEAGQAADAVAAGHLDLDYAAAGSVPAPPAADAEPMVMRGVRLPVSLDQRVRAAADQTGVPFSALIREWIELGLTDADSDRQVSLAALRRAIAHATQSGHAA